MEKLNSLKCRAVLALDSKTQRKHDFYGNLYIFSDVAGKFSFIFLADLKPASNGRYPEVTQIRERGPFTSVDEAINFAKTLGIQIIHDAPAPLTA